MVTAFKIIDEYKNWQPTRVIEATATGFATNGRSATRSIGKIILLAISVARRVASVQIVPISREILHRAVGTMTRSGTMEKAQSLFLHFIGEMRTEEEQQVLGFATLQRLIQIWI